MSRNPADSWPVAVAGILAAMALIVVGVIAPSMKEETPPPEWSRDADVVRQKDARTLEFSSAFIGHARKGEVRAIFDAMHMTDVNGLAITDPDEDGYLSVTLPDTVGDGDYYVTFVGLLDGDREAWARFGTRHQLFRMRPETRAFMYCTWYDEVREYVRYADNYGCMIKFRVTLAGTVEPAGNMADYEP